MAVQESVMQPGAQGEQLAVMSEFVPVSGPMSALEQLLNEMRMKNLEAVRDLSKNRKMQASADSAGGA